MTNINSNIHLVSNVYPVSAPYGKICIDDNPEFVSKISDHVALNKLVELKYGRMSHYRERWKHIEKVPGIKDWQVRRIKRLDECAEAGDGEKPFGLIIENGNYREICKCVKKDCRNYRKCMPDQRIEDDTAQ